ncbi:hypothetical protein [Dyella sp. 2RAB6]|uniref:hypothetical protein n=1 Tax=Dyella sp. 2RAB6 TaxID=3232992 RepID=UPI003F8E8F89
MKRRFCTASVVPVILLAALWPFSASIAADDLSTDHGLLTFVRSNDTIWTRVLGTCRDATVVRSSRQGRIDFNIKAECAVKDNLEGNMDCPAYKVDASGTVDTPSQATVRKMTLELRCSG